MTRIAEISLRTITDYVGTYSEYLVERDAQLERLRKAKHEQDEEIARMRAFIDRFRYQATKAAQVQSRIKMLDKIVPIEVPPERKRVHFTFPACPKSGRTVLELDRRPQGVRPTRRLQPDHTAHRARRSHRARRAQRRRQVDADAHARRRRSAGLGERREGHQVVMQYFAQDEANRLDPVKTVYETMEADSPVGMVPMIRNILGGFLFSGDDIYKKAGVLSGGERTRLAVARMLLRPANTLLLDEPTNHLDLDSKDVLLEALEDFGGTLIFVSHDRYFVDRLATKIVAVGHGGIEVYPGTYEQFLWSRRSANCRSTTHAVASGCRPTSAASNRPGVAPEPRISHAETPTAPGPPVSYEREEARRRRCAPAAKRDAEDRARRVAELESRIAEREREIKELEAQMAGAGFYDDVARPTSRRRQASGTHVGSRRPDESVGDAPGRGRP